MKKIPIVYDSSYLLLGGEFLSVRERILLLRIKEKQDKNLEYAKKIGIQVNIVENKNKDLKEELRNV